MGETPLKNGRITPFNASAGLLTGPAFAEPRGHWQFTEDGKGIELRPCSTGTATLCVVITRLPSSAKTLPPAERRAVCGAAMLADLQPARAKDGELTRLDGWADDIESITPESKATRYPASVVVLAENRARLDLRGTFGIVIDRIQLVRVLTPITDCK